MNKLEELAILQFKDHKAIVYEVLKRKDTMYILKILNWPNKWIYDHILESEITEDIDILDIE